ncbi:MAG: hypothetical protein M0C28_43605 [Candidatus Moduliflexus flocculans]|nr:hypothetical protein [Candidatus Moduliflexus flocculans]
MIGPRAAALLRRRGGSLSPEVPASIPGALGRPGPGGLEPRLRRGAPGTAGRSRLQHPADSSVFDLPGRPCSIPRIRGPACWNSGRRTEAVLESAPAAAPGGRGTPPAEPGGGPGRPCGPGGSPPDPAFPGERILYAAAAAARLRGPGLLPADRGPPRLGFAAAPRARSGPAEGTEGFSRPGSPGRKRTNSSTPERTGGPGIGREPRIPRSGPLREAELADLPRPGPGGPRRNRAAGNPREGNLARGRGGRRRRTRGPRRPARPAPAGTGSDREAEPGTDPSGSGSAGNPDREASRSGTRIGAPSPARGGPTPRGPRGALAMKDYRAAFEKVYSGRTRAAATAGTDLAPPDLEDAFRPVLRVPAPARGEVDPEDDPVVAGPPGRLAPHPGRAGIDPEPSGRPGRSAPRARPKRGPVSVGHPGFPSRIPPGLLVSAGFLAAGARPLPSGLRPEPIPGRQVLPSPCPLRASRGGSEAGSGPRGGRPGPPAPESRPGTGRRPGATRFAAAENLACGGLPGRGVFLRLGWALPLHVNARRPVRPVPCWPQARGRGGRGLRGVRRGPRGDSVPRPPASVPPGAPGGIVFNLALCAALAFRTRRRFAWGGILYGKSGA